MRKKIPLNLSVAVGAIFYNVNGIFPGHISLFVLFVRMHTHEHYFTRAQLHI